MFDLMEKLRPREDLLWSRNIISLTGKVGSRPMDCLIYPWWEAKPFSTFGKALGLASGKS